MKLGKVSTNVLKRSIWKQIHTRREDIVNGAGAGADCAIFAGADAGDRRMVSCVYESAVSATDATAYAVDLQGEPVRTIAQLIQKCANNLAVSGAEPVAIMLALLLPQDTEEPLIRQLMIDAENACEALSLQIAGGQTRITAAIKVPYAIVTGYGKIVSEAKAVRDSVKPGQDIVLSKWIGLEGTAILACRGRAKLLSRYPAYLVDAATEFDRYLSIVPEAATAVKSGVCAMHDASEGGIFAALWELAEGAGVGLTIDMKKLPIRQETVEICEELNVNPYELLSGGCLVMTVEDGTGLVAALGAQGIPAVIVGKITDGNDRLILNEDEVRYMDRPRQDSIFNE